MLMLLQMAIADRAVRGGTVAAPPRGGIPSARLPVHLGEVDGVCLLQRGRPLGDAALGNQTDGSVEADAGVTTLAGFDVPGPEAEAGEPVDGANEWAVLGGAFAESECEGEFRGRRDLPARGAVVWCGEVVEDAGGGWSDDW